MTIERIRHKYQRQEKNYEEMPGINRRKYLSNKIHYSPTDPDAGIALKPGKPRELYYSRQIALDTAHHVIKILKPMAKILSDQAYTSEENYQYLEQQNITRCIPSRVGIYL